MVKQKTVEFWNTMAGENIMERDADDIPALSGTARSKTATGTEGWMIPARSGQETDLQLTQ